MLGNTLLSDENFLRWLAKKLELRPYRLIANVAKWQGIGLIEQRGRQSLCLDLQQEIYNSWIENCIVSTDGRNGRNIVPLSKRKYIEKYGYSIKNSIQISEVKNKRGKVNLTAHRTVITCTIRALLKKLSDQGISVSLGKVLRLRPFFVTYPSDKEISLCLCKLCLNIKLLFECLKAQAKKDGEKLGYSISEFFMVSCPCNKSPNGYYQWKCVNEKCENCPDHQTKVLKCKNDHEKQVKIGQFETVTTRYTKNKEPKKSTKTELVELTLTMVQVFEKIVSLKKEYTVHKYQIYNDKFHWPTILSTTSSLVIFITWIFQKMLVSTSNMSPSLAILTKSNTLCTALLGSKVMHHMITTTIFQMK